jgi:hypothetical protein
MYQTSKTQNRDACLQPNKISSYTGQTTKTTKYDWVHGLNTHLTSPDRLSVTEATNHARILLFEHDGWMHRNLT